MDAKQMIEDRRSVNNFDPTRKIDDETLKNIINLAVNAPSAYNLQPWRIIVIKSDEAKERLFNLAFQQPKVKEAAINLLIVGNRYGWDASNTVWDEMLQSVGENQEIVDTAKSGAAWVYGSSEEMQIKFAEANAGLLAMSIMYSAKALGVDSHPMNGFDFAGIHKEFGLGEHEAVVMNITLGYRNEAIPLHARRPRRGFDEIAEVI